MPLVGGHCRSQRQVLCGRARIARAGQRETQPELGIIVGWASLHYQPEIPGGCGILARVELGPGERLQDAARARLSSRSPLEQLGRRRRAAPAEQVQAALVQLMGVGSVASY